MMKVLGFAEKNASKKFQKHILPNGGLFNCVIYRDFRIRKKSPSLRIRFPPQKVANLRIQKTPLLIIQVRSNWVGSNRGFLGLNKNPKSLRSG